MKHLHFALVSDKARLKQVSSATETSEKIEISLVASLHVDMILSIKRRKALISLRGCAGRSAPLLFAKPRRQVFSCRGQFILHQKNCSKQFELNIDLNDIDSFFKVFVKYIWFYTFTPRNDKATQTVHTRDTYDFAIFIIYPTLFFFF